MLTKWIWRRSLKINFFREGFSEEPSCKESGRSNSGPDIDTTESNNMGDISTLFVTSYEIIWADTRAYKGL